MSTIHPLVRDLYKRALLVGRDYPLGLGYVRDAWKRALRDPSNTPSCFRYPSSAFDAQCEREIYQAVAKGRHMVREMIGIIQLKKYRAMRKRYGTTEVDDELQDRIRQLEQRTDSTDG